MTARFYHQRGSLPRGWQLILTIFCGHYWLLDPFNVAVMINISSDKCPLNQFPVKTIFSIYLQNMLSLTPMYFFIKNLANLYVWIKVMGTLLMKFHIICFRKWIVALYELDIITLCQVCHLSLSAVRGVWISLCNLCSISHPFRLRENVSWRYCLVLLRNYGYRQVSNIRRTESQNLNVSRLGLQLSWRNIVKPCVKPIMKM